MVINNRNTILPVRKGKYLLKKLCGGLHEISFCGKMKMFCNVMSLNKRKFQWFEDMTLQIIFISPRSEISCKQLMYHFFSLSFAIKRQLIIMTLQNNREIIVYTTQSA